MGIGLDIVDISLIVLPSTHQTVEDQSLPYRARTTKHPVDCNGCEAFDAAQRPCHGVFTNGSGQKMHMVGHDNKMMQYVSSAMEKQKGVEDNFPYILILEYATAMAGVEPPFLFLSKKKTVFSFGIVIPWLWMRLQPLYLQCFPFLQLCFWEGVGKTESDKLHFPRLMPMRKCPPGDADEFVLLHKLQKGLWGCFHSFFSCKYTVFLYNIKICLVIFVVFHT